MIQLINNATLLNLNIVYSKTQIREFMRVSSVLKFEEALRSHFCLRYYKDKVVPSKDWKLSLSDSTVWWIKVRIGGIWLGERNYNIGCPACGMDLLETVEHFLIECEILRNINGT